MTDRGTPGLNTLFTSVGRRVELLRSFRRAYQGLGLEGKIIAIDMDPLAPALQVADRAFVVPPLRQPSFMPRLLELCQQEQVGLLFPLIDPDIPVLARHKPALEAVGVRAAVVSEEAAALTSDKWLTHQFLRQLGLPTPHSWLPADGVPDRTEYPLFVKPRFGSASRDVHTVHEPDALHYLLSHVPSPIVQEYLPGPEITSDVICDLDGEVLAVVSRQRIEVRWGEVAKGVTVSDTRIMRACVQIAQALPAIGPITVQCMMKDNVPHFTEINARFGGGVPLGIAAGVDSPRWLLARAAGLPAEIPPLGSYQQELYLSRFDDSFFLSLGEQGEATRKTSGGPDD